jgi:hypothetical protein
MAGLLDYELNTNQYQPDGYGYGLRWAGTNAGAPLTKKQRGYFGEMRTPDNRPIGELSSEFEYDGKNIAHPLIVPTLTKEELDLLISGGRPTEDIFKKAQMWALSRIERGQDPFATQQDIRFPMPQSGGLLAP